MKKPQDERPTLSSPRKLILELEHPRRCCPFLQLTHYAASFHLPRLPLCPLERHRSAWSLLWSSTETWLSPNQAASPTALKSRGPLVCALHASPEEGLVSSSLPVTAVHLCSPSGWQFGSSETHSFIHSSLNSFDKSLRAPVVCQHVFKLWGYKDIMWLNLPLPLLAAVITNFWFTVYHSEKILTSVLQSYSPPHTRLQDKFSFL